MTLILILRRALTTTLLSLALLAADAAPAAPNLVVLLLDDLSTDAMQAMLDDGRLPQISTHVVAGGVTFDNAFVTNAECCPSRATLLTGQYSHNHGVLSNHDLNPLQGGIAWAGWLPQGNVPGREDSTIATWLDDAGYHTAFIGKYLNGYGLHAPAGVADPRTYVPAGWDEWNGLLSPSLYRVYDYELNDDGEVVAYGDAAEDYQTDVLAERAVEFINRVIDDEAPFFLLVSPLAPHIEVVDPLAPLTGNDPTGGYGLDIRPAPRHEYLIDGDEDNGEIASPLPKPSFNEGSVADKPSCPREEPGEAPQLVSHPHCVAERPAIEAEEEPLIDHQYKSMLASVIAVDDLLGEIVGALTAAGEIDDTVILLTSDNGWFFGEHRLIGKALAYEESIRVPFVLRVPGGIAGGHSDAVVLNNDIAPTLADLAGIGMPYDADGASVVPLVMPGAAADWFERKRFLVERWFIPSLLKFESPTYLALRQLGGGADFTYIASRTDPQNFAVITHRELYDLNTDPYQLDAYHLGAQSAAGLDNFLRLFRACSGEICRIFESF